MMLGFICQLTGLRNAQTANETLLLGVICVSISGRDSIWMDRLSKEDCPPSSMWVGISQYKQKGSGSVTLLTACLRMECHLLLSHTRTRGSWTKELDRFGLKFLWLADTIPSASSYNKCTHTNNIHIHTYYIYLYMQTYTHPYAPIHCFSGKSWLIQVTTPLSSFSFVSFLLIYLLKIFKCFSLWWLPLITWMKWKRIYLLSFFIMVVVSFFPPIAETEVYQIC